MPTVVIKQGSARPILIANVRDTDGNLITNWAGYTVLAQIRQRPDSAAVLYQWSNDDDNVTFEDSNILLQVDPDVSLAWTWTHGQMDVFLTNPAGTPDCIGEAHVTVDRAISRS